MTQLWVPEHIYNPGEMVRCCGHLYLCRKSHKSSLSFKEDSLKGHAWIWKDFPIQDSADESVGLSEERDSEVNRNRRQEGKGRKARC